MEQTWKPTVVGILNLIAGGLALFGLAATLFLGFVLSAVPELREDEVGLLVVQGVLGFAVLATLTLSLLALVGGVSAIQRRRWGWTIAGSVASTLICPPLGVPAIILVVLAEPEIRGLPVTGQTG
jgi:hypothetical protein